jgi:hypothetical protein
MHNAPPAGIQGKAENIICVAFKMILSEMRTPCSEYPCPAPYRSSSLI